MPTMFQQMADSLAVSSSYNGLDANGNTPEDIRCLADPNCDMNQHLLNTLNLSISQGLNCDGTDCGAGIVNQGIPSYVWLLGAGALAFVLLKR